MTDISHKSKKKKAGQFWSGKPGGSGFPNPEVPDLGVGCHMPCNKFVFSSCGLENKLYCVILCGEPCLDALN